MDKNNKSSITLIIVGLLGAIISYLFYDFIWRMFIVFIGLIITVWGLAELLYFLNAKVYKIERIGLSLFKSICLITIGVLILIPWSSAIIQMLVSFIVGGYILINCIIRLYHAQDKLLIIKKDIFKYIIAFLVIGLGINNIGKFIVVGLFIVCFVIGIVQIIKGSKPLVNKEKIEKTDLKYEIKDPEE